MTYSARKLTVGILTTIWSCIGDVSGDKISCIFKQRAVIVDSFFLSNLIFDIRMLLIL